MDDLAARALHLLRGLDVDVLDEAVALFRELEPGTRAWGVLGYAVADRLGAAGRTAEADAVREELDAELG